MTNAILLSEILQQKMEYYKHLGFSQWCGFKSSSSGLWHWVMLW